MKRNRPLWRATVPTLVIIACFALVTAVSAGTGDDNDLSNPEVGVEWVTEYYWPSQNLPSADDCALGFYNTLGNAGWTQKFNKGTGTVAVDQWVSDGLDSSYVDGADIVMFVGHGANNLIKLATDPLHWVYFDCCEWGDYDLEWMLLHSCHTTQIPGNFKSNKRWALNGAHLICGFDTDAYDYAEDGASCAQKLLNGYKVRLAWYTAIDETHPDGIRVGIVGENSDCANDRIWGEGSVIADPVVDSEIYRWLYTCS